MAAASASAPPMGAHRIRQYAFLSLWLADGRSDFALAAGCQLGAAGECGARRGPLRIRAGARAAKSRPESGFRQVVGAASYQHPPCGSLHRGLAHRTGAATGLKTRLSAGPGLRQFSDRVLLKATELDRPQGLKVTPALRRFHRRHETSLFRFLPGRRRGLARREIKKLSMAAVVTRVHLKER